MKNFKLLPLLLVSAILLVQAFSGNVSTITPMSTGDSNQRSNESTLVDIGDGQTIEVAPDETLHKFILTDQGWVEWTGESSPLDASEFGNATITENNLEMEYLPTNVTSTVTVDVPTGNDWEAYQASAILSDVTENRTWTQNPDLDGSASGWTTGTTSGGAYSSEVSNYNSSGHGVGDGSFDFFINSNSVSEPYYYSGNDRAWARQTMTVPRGEVVWAGFRTDYWADTRDDTHYAMTGAFSIYLTIESSWTWELSFTEIVAEETWYDSGMVEVPSPTFNLPTDTSIDLEVGLWCKGTYGYAPNILPAAKFDNIELYLKTRTNPSDLNMEMNGNAISDGTTTGTGSVVDIPATPWTTNPVTMNFTWAPTPINPNPNRTILVEYDLNLDLYARRLNFGTVNEINPDAYGERFTIQNGTDAYYSTYFYADIPSGYPNKYFFNMSIPDNRDVYFVARPLAPSTNLTSGWNGGEPNDGFLNVSAYAVATEAGRYGYWRVLSSSPNMISDIELYDPNTLTWSRNVDLRAGNSTQLRAYLGSDYINSVINFTVYDPDGNKWYSANATADGSGYATTNTLTFAGANASAGSWMIQAFCNDKGTNTDWRSTGFFKRPFTVSHTSALTINYPDDAVGTWETNVTFGDLLLVIITANDTDSNTLVSGGTLTMNWIAGSDTFDDSGNGQYTKVIDTSVLTNKGQYIINLEWSANNYDTAIAALTVNVNYEAELTSPDYPGIQGPIGSNQSFVVQFKNVNGTGILGARISTNWTGIETISELGLGLYQVTLDSSGMPIGEYPIIVSATSKFVDPQTMLMFIEIREIYNTASYSANKLSIPVGENASFTITWYDTDNDQPIQGKSAFITCNWTSFHSLGEQNYTVVESNPGVYTITLFTEIDDPLTVPSDLYSVEFNLSMKDYQNHTFTIDVEIRRHNTLFILDAPVEQTPVGQDLVVLVFYQDTDLLEGITNDTFYVDVNVTTPEVSLLSFTSSASSLGDGHYNITIPSSQWGSIGWKNLTLTIGWTGGDTYYAQVLNTRVRILGTETDLYLEIAPTATNYLDNFTFTLVYYDTVNTTKISNSSNNVYMLITPITAGHSVTQADFVFNEIGTTGTYSFELNASLFGTASTFKFQIDFLWSKGVNPLYENQTITVTLVVLGIPTYVDYTPVQSTAYGEIANYSFSYMNQLTTEKIANSSSLSVSLVESGIIYTVSYDSTSKTFTLSIDTNSLSVGTSVLTLNVIWFGEPWYEQELQTFTVTVTYRSTQLSHQSFASPQYGDTVSITFIYTDLVAGSSSGMTGILSLDSSLSNYTTVTPLGNGYFLVELDTDYFSSTGIFLINASIIYTGTNNAANASESFTLNVIERVTQMGYETPDPTSYLDNVTFEIFYTDGSTATPILGAQVVISCSNSTSPLVLSSNYWISDKGDGTYTIAIDSTALGSVGIFVLEVNLTKSGSPFYASVLSNINARVSQRTTQILITQTPGEVAFNEFVVFRFKYTDFLTSASISITKANIILTHGSGMTLIADVNYTLSYSSGIYTIMFNSTLLNESALISNYPLQISVDASSGVPYYAPRSITMQVTISERPTQILFPLVEETPYYDNITIYFEYIDFITGTGIEGASVVVDFLNGSSPIHYIQDQGAGLYEVIVPTEQFGSIGTIYFNVSLSKAGIPFYSNRLTTDVPAKITLVPAMMVAEVPQVASQPVGQPMVINITLTTTHHNEPITGATISSDWYSLYSTDITISEIGLGVYRIILNTTGLIAQQYAFTVQSELAFHATVNISLSVTPGSASADILLDQTTVYVDWGDMINLRLDVRDPYYGTYIPGMNTTILWNGTLYEFTDIGNGTYIIYISSTDNDFGIYQPQITITREYYSPKQKTMTFVVSKATGSLTPSQSLYSIVTGSTVEFYVYLNDTNHNLPITSAIVTMEWNNTMVDLVANGTAGFYVGAIDASNFAIGQYELSLAALETNYIILDQLVDIYIEAIPITLSLPNNATSLTVYYGDNLTILLTLDDDYNGGHVSGANVTYALAGISGQMTDLLNGSYTTTIDTSELAAQKIYLRVVAALEFYETTITNYLVNIQPIPTSLDVDLSTKDGYYGDDVVYEFTLTNSLTGVSLIGADVEVTWAGGTSVVTDHGDGRYSVSLHLNLTSPRSYDVNVRFTLTNYDSITKKVILDLNPFPVTILGTTSISIPVNDTATYLYSLNNTILNQIVSDAFGIANWVNIEQVTLEQLENGSYILDIPNDLQIGTYTIDLSFSNELYLIAPFQIQVLVRQVNTALKLIGSDTNRITILPNEAFQIVVAYQDLDHGGTISNAIVSYTVNTPNGDAVTYYADFLQVDPTDPDEGTYLLTFSINTGGTFNIRIQLSRGDYAAASIDVEVISDFTPEAALVQTTAYLGSAILILSAVLMFYYVKVWSIPKLIRAMNRMIKSLQRGKVPRPAIVSTRQEILVSIINEELTPMRITKVPDEIVGESIEAHIPEINALIDRLAEITGLGELEIESFRADLSKMKASERPGFIKEVIEQEEARRADALAKIKEIDTKVEEKPDVLESAPDELEDIRQKLVTKGMSPDEIDVIIEEAKNLSKADLEALLDSLGIRLD